MRNVTNKNSSVKTVAGDNTTENFNEQAEAAPVINQSNNEETIMEVTDFQSSMVPQTGACETTPGSGVQEVATVSDNESATDANNQVETIETSTVAVLLACLGDKIPKIIRKVCMSYLEAKKAGLKICFFKFNREVNNSHVKALYKSVKDSMRFTRSCYVVPLRPILERFKDIEVYDLDGNQITLDTPDIELYLIVYDGQHRLTVCEFHSEVDVELELNEFNGMHPLDTIKLINSDQRNWNGQDLRDSNVNAGITTNKLYGEAKILQERYGITNKAAECALTFVLNTTRISDLIAGRDTTKFNEDNANRGKGILNACMMNFAACKEAKKIELLYAIIHTHINTPDKEKGVFGRNMKLLMGTMSADDRETVKRFITEKNFGQLNTFVKDSYKAFLKLGYSEEVLTQMESELDERIATYIEKVDEENREKLTKKPLKSGRVSELIKHDLAVKNNIDQERLAKAIAANDNAQRKAQEAKDAVDRLKDSISSKHITSKVQ
ncbi:MAG: hypothetical protein IKW46_04690 [Bacteroidaceae bacterium]|nr:hypothetical protein [Bacteroidaceae bacterium]